MSGPEVRVARDPGAALAARRFAVGDIHMGPTTHLADERARLAGLRWEHFDVRQLAPTIGAELHGIDLTGDISDPAIAEIRRALHAFKVIFFRDQPLTPTQHVAFARRFGDLEIHPFIPPNPDVPELVRFEKTAEVAGYENAWHHDVTWRERPSMGAILHAVTVPDVGGDTLFCDMFAAYDGLDAAVRARIDELDAIHDYARAFGRQVPAEQVAEMRARFPQVAHPVAPRHEVTGRRHLYVNRVFVDHLEVGEASDGADLFELLCRQADYPEYQCRFRWEPHSVAFWDNRAVQHYASSDYWPEVRIMERASIVGTRPSR